MSIHLFTFVDSPTVSFRRVILLVLVLLPLLSLLLSPVSRRSQQATTLLLHRLLTAGVQENEWLFSSSLTISRLLHRHITSPSFFFAQGFLSFNRLSPSFVVVVGVVMVVVTVVVLR